VGWVDQGSSAAEAGIQAGDVIIAVNGSPISGTDRSEILRNDLHGTAGGSVHVTVVKRDGASREIVLTRRPYPPHLNSESDLFRYSIPGNWQMDLRYPFPLPWSPAIDHKGVEDLAFASGFDDTASPEYHSYLILWWLGGSKPLTADRPQSDMIAYFRGLAEHRGETTTSCRIFRRCRRSTVILTMGRRPLVALQRRASTAQ
jgi:PDZ domain